MSILCPKCGSPLHNLNVCDHCHSPIIVYKRIQDISKVLYNQGLQKARVRDLSGAIDLLNRSVRLDKNNVDARNLLGLIYFEIGETVTALQHWVISKNIRPVDNQAIYFLDKIQNNTTYLDKLSNAIKKYNQSLHYIHQNSVDLAIIQLKKVTSLNPKFIKAYCLLALCYVKDQQEDKAKKVLLKVMSIDKSHYVARKYLDAMAGDTLSENDFQAVEEKKEAPLGMPLKFKVSGAMVQFVAMAAGVAIGILIMALMIMPSKLDEKNDQITDLNQSLTDYQTTMATSTTTISELETRLKTLEQDLKDEVQAHALAENEIAEIIVLLEALKDYTSGDGTSAALALYEVNINMLPEEVRATYEALIGAIYPSVAEEAYNLGYKHYKNGKYAEAVVELEKSYKFEQQADYTHRVLYFWARSYYKMDEIDTSLPIFKKLVEDFPDSTYVSDANYFININED